MTIRYTQVTIRRSHVDKGVRKMTIRSIQVTIRKSHVDYDT